MAQYLGVDSNFLIITFFCNFSEKRVFILKQILDSNVSDSDNEFDLYISDLSFYGNRSIAIAIDRLKCYHSDPVVDRANANRGAT